MNSTNIFLVFIAYLLGSIPTAVWVSRFFYKIDIRDYGSKNAGATNTFRVLGKKAGIPVLLIDILKGWLAVQLIYLSDYIVNSEVFINLQIVLALTSLLGHVFPVFAGFKGGKGVATILGAVIAIQPYAALISIFVFLIILIITKYVSLGSIIAATLFPFTVILFSHSFLSVYIFSFGTAFLIIITHIKNIKRLIRGQEPKIILFRSKT